MFAINGIEADYFARQMEIEHMLAPVTIDDIGFYGTRPDCGYCFEGFAFAKDMLAGMEWSDMLDQHVQVHERSLVHSLRQAGLREGASGTEMQGITVVGKRAPINPREFRLDHRPLRHALRSRGRSAA